MATVVGFTSVGTGIRYNLGATDDLFVPAGSSVVSTDSRAVAGGGLNNSVTVFGAIHGAFLGIDIGDGVNGATSARVYVGPNGSVSSDPLSDSGAIRLFGSGALVINDGAISGHFGLILGSGGSGTAANTVVNRGLISGGNIAITQFNPAQQAVVVKNFGDLMGNNYAVRTFGTTEDLVMNRGTIVGTIELAGGNDRLDNRDGRIEGDVLMGDGDDVVVNRGGIINGTVYGGAGNDRYVASATQEDVFDGGAGIDIMDYRWGGAVVVALDGSFENAGAALNDEITGVEHVYGSRTGGDTIRGNQAANLLRGEGGADRLEGAGGADVLIGGRGKDTLSGGGGNDTFVYQNLNQIGDVITDFRGDVGNDDRFQINASAFGGGLVAGSLAPSQFQTRADNVAQDANDRFIFRTTDRSLWFDADGNGAGAPVMVADLQANAIVTVADIFLV